MQMPGAIATPAFKLACDLLHDIERDGSRLNRHSALDLCWSMIFSEIRQPLFRIML
jgi:hypothetical protein